MSGVIHFTSGKTITITEEEYRVIGPKLRDKGIKSQVTKAGHLIPLNSSTMEFVEHIPEELPGDNPKPVKVKEKVVKESESPKTNDEIISDMTAKSNCKHEPDKLELFVQHTAKGVRYFPVCSFCGKRERYISESKILNGEYEGTPNEKWTEESLANALPWVEK
jgi:hypothetical protein